MGDGVQAVEGLELPGGDEGVLLQVQPAVGGTAVALKRAGVGVQQVEGTRIVEFSRLEIQGGEVPALPLLWKGALVSGTPTVMLHMVKPTERW